MHGSVDFCERAVNYRGAFQNRPGTQRNLPTLTLTQISDHTFMQRATAQTQQLSPFRPCRLAESSKQNSAQGMRHWRIQGCHARLGGPCHGRMTSDRFAFDRKGRWQRGGETKEPRGRPDTADALCANEPQVQLGWIHTHRLPTTRPYHQRCAVRITYTKNATQGVWEAHGRYIARESATTEGKPNSAGFDSKGRGIDVAGRLQKWQAAKDELLWNIPLRRTSGMAYSNVIEVGSCL
jgi:hypothetical protein